MYISEQLPNNTSNLTKQQSSNQKSHLTKQSLDTDYYALRDLKLKHPNSFFLWYFKIN